MLDRDPEKAKATLRSIRATGQAAIAEMGTLLALVRGDGDVPRPPQPSLADVHRLVESIRAGGLAVDLVVDGEPRDLSPAVELSAYRIVQEGLTNAVKHAPSAKVQAVVRYRDETIEVEVSDDGAGQTTGVGTRRGLAGIRERVSVFGGHFESGQRPGGGWLLRATLPAR